MVLPLSITYDRIAEEEGFLRELDGTAKHKGGLAPLARWTMKLMGGKIKLGRIHIRSGAALRLDADSDIKVLSHRIVAELQRHTAVTTFHLRAFCHGNARLGIDPTVLRNAIVRRGGEVIVSKLGGEREVPPLLQRTYEGQWMHLFYADARHRAPGNAAVASHIRRNGFWFPESPRFDDAITDVVVEALFEPICADYVRVAYEVEATAADAELTAHELVGRIPGVFLRDVEDALDDLAERGVLARERDIYRWADGRRSLEEFRSDCMWQAAGMAAR